MDKSYLIELFENIFEGNEKNVINKYRATMIEKKNCLQKRICQRLAPSNDFTIIPPKLKHIAPSKTSAVPGILFNSVNLSL